MTKIEKVLVLSGLFPPNVIGGAEISAWNLSRGLASQGFGVTVVTTATDKNDQKFGEEIDGMTVWRVLMPRPYPMMKYPSARTWQKPIWHLYDHLHPRNVTIIDKIFSAVRPDAVSVHIAQGLGHNILGYLARKDVSVNYFLHDLGLACIRQSMYKNGQNCPNQCITCKLSSRYKISKIKEIKRIGFCSPSKANLLKLSRHVPIHEYPNAVILNPNKYPISSTHRDECETPRFIYVGRLQATKGTDLLLRVLKRIAETHRFKILMVGTGPDEAKLRREYGSENWCEFSGFISQQQIADHLQNSDLLFIPSVWAENSPGVVIHAALHGVPCIGSNAGGIPELIVDNLTGRLVEPNNDADWYQAITQVLNTPGQLAKWRSNTLAAKGRFDEKNILRDVISFMDDVYSGNHRSALD